LRGQFPEAHVRLLFGRSGEVLRGARHVEVQRPKLGRDHALAEDVDRAVVKRPGPALSVRRLARADEADLLAPDQIDDRDALEGLRLRVVALGVVQRASLRARTLEEAILDALQRCRAGGEVAEDLLIPVV